MLPDVKDINKSIAAYCKEDDNNFRVLKQVSRHGGVWYYGDTSLAVHINSKDKMIIAELIIQSSTGNKAVRATYKAPPCASPYIFYVGRDIKEIEEAFKKLFSLKLEEVEKLELKQTWNFPV